MAIKLKKLFTVGILPIVLYVEVNSVSFREIRRYFLPISVASVNVHSENLTVVNKNETKEDLKAAQTSTTDPKSEYTAFYPLNYHDEVKKLNLTQKPGSDDVQSRIMNHPEIYQTHYPDHNNLEYDVDVRPPKYNTDPYGIQDDCFCVPYYLCKDGFVNSGGRQIELLTRARNLDAKRNKTITKASLITQSSHKRTISTKTCDAEKVCCRLSFSDGHLQDDNYYPVATPQPDYIHPSRFPEKYPQSEVCGIRRAYGVQGRLQNLLYSSDVTEFGEYPWQVAVLKKVKGDRNLYLCGGVLISQQWVATAAHCVKHAYPSTLQMRMGEWDVNRKDEIYQYIEEDVEAIVIHPEFDPGTLQNDIAVIRIMNPVSLDLPHVTSACLPPPWMVFDDHRCWVSGWGKDFFGPQGVYQNVLKEVDVPVLSHHLCEVELQNTKLGHNFRLHPGFLCAGGEAGKDACTGDGGSPLVCEHDGLWYVVGLVSWGIGCGQPRIPGVYVNVAYYNDWMNDILWR